MKKAVISSLYNNVPTFKNRDLLANQFERYCEQIDADFVNISVDKKTWIVDFFASGTINESSNISKKYAQLGKLDILQHAFSMDYDWVAWIDADVILHTNADTVFPVSLQKDTVYWLEKSFESREEKIAHGHGPLLFEESLKKKYREKYTRYGNMGLFVIHKKMWNYIKKGLRKYTSPSSFFDPVEDMQKFQARIEQACMALLVNNLDIKTNAHPTNPFANTMFHLLGKNQVKAYEFLGLEFPKHGKNKLPKVELIDRLLERNDLDTLFKL